MIKGFKEFLLRGNIVDLSIAVVIGTAFTALVTKFTESIIQPLIDRIGAGGESDYGQARGFLDTRSADAGIVHAQGEGVHVDTIKAVPGTKSAPFNLDSNGAFVFSPPIGDW